MRALFFCSGSLGRIGAGPGGVQEVPMERYFYVTGLELIAIERCFLWILLRDFFFFFGRQPEKRNDLGHVTWTHRAYTTYSMNENN